jgi:hypothetical protein
LNGLRNVDLRPLESLTGLTYLTVHKPKPNVDLSPLAHLASLEDVHLESANDATDKAIADLDYSRPTRLWRLSLVASSPGARMPVDLDWVSTQRRLRDLYLYGFWPRGLSLEAFYGLTASVKRVFILTTNPEDFARLLHSRPPSKCHRGHPAGQRVWTRDPRSRRIAVHRGRPGQQPRLRDQLRRGRAPGSVPPAHRTRRRLAAEMGHRSGEVVVLSDDEAALQHVRKVLRADKW